MAAGIFMCLNVCDSVERHARWMDEWMNRLANTAEMSARSTIGTHAHQLTGACGCVAARSMFGRIGLSGASRRGGKRCMATRWDAQCRSVKRVDGKRVRQWNLMLGSMLHDFGQQAVMRMVVGVWVSW